EAVLGAVWLDGGIAAAKMVFDRLELPIGEKFNEWGDNPKGYLQVLSQARKPARLPKYTVLEEKGPSHAPTVTVMVEVQGMGSAVATADSRRRAETAAAIALLDKVNGQAD
ncbi:MAG: ribonuclease III, partial [Kiritimatiellae bacterium]|nr:ribonuclease III [Kiritimatiellia bacterium]